MQDIHNRENCKEVTYELLSVPSGEFPVKLKLLETIKYIPKERTMGEINFNTILSLIDPKYYFNMQSIFFK